MEAEKNTEVPAKAGKPDQTAWLVAAQKKKKKDDKEKNKHLSARLRGVAMSAQKARLVADQIRGKSVEEALDILTFSTKKGAAVIKKLLDSSIANAENNKGADVDELKVSTICVDEGITMKRIRPRAKGRADRILKRTCHISIKLVEQ